MGKPNRSARKMTLGRVLEISNHVSEEFTDLGKTDFATKKELCEVIRFWQRHSDKWNTLHQKLIGNVAVFAAEVLKSPMHGSYSVTVSWGYLEHQLENFNEGGLLDLDPDFQRGHVWTLDKQVAYVEFILRGGASSRDILFNSSSWNNGMDTPIQLVDGKQRLEAVRKFMRNELVVFGETRRDDLGSFGASGPHFNFIVNDLKTRAEVLTWYLELNSGGVVHTEEELDRVRDMLTPMHACGLPCA